MILNVKEEGLEERILHMMKQFSIEDFFFLDQSFPFLIKYANLDESRCAVRFSEFESIDTVLNLKNKVDQGKPLHCNMYEDFAKYPDLPKLPDELGQSLNLLKNNKEMNNAFGKEVTIYPFFLCHSIT